jgi:hypothetical protein
MVVSEEDIHWKVEHIARIAGKVRKNLDEFGPEDPSHEQRHPHGIPDSHLFERKVAKDNESRVGEESEIEE